MWENKTALFYSKGIEVIPLMDKQTEMIEMCKELRLPSIRHLLQQENKFEQHASPAEFM